LRSGIGDGWDGVNGLFAFLSFLTGSAIWSLVLAFWEKAAYPERISGGVGNMFETISMQHNATIPSTDYYHDVLDVLVISVNIL